MSAQSPSARNETSQSETRWPRQPFTPLQLAIGLAVALFSLGTLAAGLTVGTPNYPIALFGALALATVARFWWPVSFWLDFALFLYGTGILFSALGAGGEIGSSFWLALATLWLLAWLFAERLSQAIAGGSASARFGFIVPTLFGISILLVWELITRGAGIPTILLPPPSMIFDRIMNSWPILLADFRQTILKAVLVGYVLGSGAGFLVAIAIDRSPFLKRGLLPLGNFVAALPIIGIAPIMVMWFGFDWQSKAAVVIVMTFFPMLVSTIAGLNASGHIERDLMRTYAAGYFSTLLRLRLPAAAPMIFNALKINTTLALIGAIVAEFFGTPTVGMGFRISTEVGRMNVDMVWAEIAMAAVVGSAFYGLVTLIERAVTFWHPTVRDGRA
ncbi:MAG: ABC transporter permease [Alphaproteobacteria bacterium]|nr:ABC transporter permease [Alphaproteobacteria bacterium]